jgi:hypothetical protein
MPASAPPNTHAVTSKPIWKLVVTCTYPSGCRPSANGRGAEASYDPIQLKARIARFLHDHKGDAADAS